MNPEQIKAELEENVPGCVLEIVQNPSPSAQHSLLLVPVHAVASALYLRDAAHLRFDFCSNVTGVDWPLREVVQKVKVKQVVEGVEKDVEETRRSHTGGYLEVVYHLFSMEKGTGPVILRMRTCDRDENVSLPSLTPVWRSAEFQEREIFDLFGVRFEGHPDLRRLLMWEGFADFPMRRDYVDPDDYEYEPTAHDEVLRRTEEHYRAELGGTP